MRMLRSVLAIAFVFASGTISTRAAELPASSRPPAEVADHFIDAGLKKESIKPAPTADDATLIRRLTLDLVGRIPTPGESRAYLESKDPEKRAKLVDRLMASPGFVRHQATELDTLLMAGNRGSLREFLIRAVGANQSWDRIFRELMLPNETDKSRKVAAEYLRGRVKDLDKLTADVSSTFFGVNISCAQCHDHPLVSDWKQDHYFGMKAFLNRTFDNGEFLGERNYGIVKFKTTSGAERLAGMMFLSGKKAKGFDAAEPSRDEQKAEKTQLDKSKKEKVPPPPPKKSARAELVEVSLQPGDRDFFAKAIVNRVWNRLFGRGLVMPLDQMHSANPPSHPELLDWLARDTIEHGYDLRRLIKGLVLSGAYSRSSRWEAGEPPKASFFAFAAVRPLTPMQMANSLRIAAADPTTLTSDLKIEDFEKRIEGLENAARPLAASFVGTGESIAVSEALLFSNGEKIAKELLADGGDRLVGRLKKTSNPREQVDLAVRNILSRPPDEDDLRSLTAYLTQRTDRPEEAARQVVWALLTCPEFRFNH